MHTQQGVLNTTPCLNLIGGHLLLLGSRILAEEPCCASTRQRILTERAPCQLCHLALLASAHRFVSPDLTTNELSTYIQSLLPLDRLCRVAFRDIGAVISYLRAIELGTEPDWALAGS